MKVDVLNMQGEKVRQVELPAEIFEAKVNVDLMHQAYQRQMANARLGTHRDQGSLRGGRRWSQAVETKGYRSRPSGFDDLRTVGRRWTYPHPTSAEIHTGDAEENASGRIALGFIG